MEPQPTERKQRLLQVFGEALPQATCENLEDHWEQSEQARDQWLLDNCPPHHDGPA